MSTRDEPSLSEREQAILAGLAAKAEAEDPTLAAALRGRRRAPSVRVPAVPVPLRHWGWGAVLAVVGLLLVVLSLSAGLTLGVVGALAAFAGVGRVAVSAPWAQVHPAEGPEPD
jgi:hypothetical protein